MFDDKRRACLIYAQAGASVFKTCVLLDSQNLPVFLKKFGKTRVLVPVGTTSVSIDD
ncbi:MAG: hypothetical protein FWD57_11125 [Polyangiaceae bacterium]|nr:hypothetical protein [Polyangiaceae bacterium]